MKLSIAVLFVASAAAFSPEKAIKQATGSVIAASTILSNVAFLPPPAMAVSPTDSMPSQVLAGRSGGRAGGRAAPRARAAPSRAPTKVIERQTTVIQQPMYGGGAYMAPPMYAPQPSGLGLAIGLNAVSAIGEGMREARQENEIRSTRDQLNEARIKEAEMEARLRQLESAQMAR